MAQQRFLDWIQIATGIGVSIGLILVIFELQQTQAISLAQLTSDGADQALQRHIADLGETPYVAYEKACSDQSALTGEDFFILDASNRQLLLLVQRAYVINDRTDLYDEVWKAIAGRSFPRVLDNEPGRIWWELFRTDYPHEIRVFGNSMLEEARADNWACRPHQWREKLNKSDGATDNDARVQI